MASLRSIAELAWSNLFPKPSDETKIRKEHFIASAKNIYTAAIWIRAKEEKRENGYYEVPSHLLAESDPLPVRNGEVDTASLKALTSLPDGMWLQEVLGDCYVKTTFNQWKMLKDDDGNDDTKKYYYPMGTKVKFPHGANEKEVRLLYARLGSTINDDIEIDDTLAHLVREKLEEVYSRKGQEDKTNNTNSES